MDKNLIYDVGMNNGDDTAYYLSKGYHVVAIEADPTLVEAARNRFKTEINNGRLIIHNVGIGPENGIAQFWICEGCDKWNSFDRNIASREGLPCHPIDVICRPFRDLLKENGVPYYLKVDIEGNDHLCLMDLNPTDIPKYISVEMDGLFYLTALRDLGFNAFKCITQTNHRQLIVEPLNAKRCAKLSLRQYPHLFNLLKRTRSSLYLTAELLHLRTKLSSLANIAPGDHWRFPIGSSGPFGEDIDGEWQSFDEVLYCWLNYKLGYTDYGQPNLGIWHDVHATRI